MRTPRRLVVIAANPRSGSSLLAAGLTAAGVFASAVEHANPYRLSWNLGIPGSIRRRVRGSFFAVDRARDRTIAAALQRVASDNLTADGTFGLKIMWQQFERQFLNRGLDLDLFGAPIEWIRIRREDRLREAVSYLRAEQSGVWKSEGPGTRGTRPAGPVYDPARIAELLSRFTADESGWDRYLSARRARPLEITYEQLDRTYEVTMRLVLDHVGATTAPVPVRQLRRQADELSEEWVERYRSESIGRTG